MNDELLKELEEKVDKLERQISRLLNNVNSLDNSMYDIDQALMNQYNEIKHIDCVLQKHIKNSTTPILITSNNC